MTVIEYQRGSCLIKSKAVRLVRCTEKAEREHKRLSKRIQTEMKTSKNYVTAEQKKFFLATIAYYNLFEVSSKRPSEDDASHPDTVLQLSFFREKAKS